MAKRDVCGRRWCKGCGSFHDGVCTGEDVEEGWWNEGWCYDHEDYHRVYASSEEAIAALSGGWSYDSTASCVIFFLALFLFTSLFLLTFSRWRSAPSAVPVVAPPIPAVSLTVRDKRLTSIVGAALYILRQERGNLQILPADQKRIERASKKIEASDYLGAAKIIASERDNDQLLRPDRHLLQWAYLCVEQAQRESVARSLGAVVLGGHALPITVE